MVIVIVFFFVTTEEVSNIDVAGESSLGIWSTSYNFKIWGEIRPSKASKILQGTTDNRHSTSKMTMTMTTMTKRPSDNLSRRNVRRGRHHHDDRPWLYHVLSLMIMMIMSVQTVAVVAAFAPVSDSIRTRASHADKLFTTRTLPRQPATTTAAAATLHAVIPSPLLLDGIITSSNDMINEISSLLTSSSSSSSVASATSWLDVSRDQAEQLAGPFFGASLFPYLAFLWLLARPANETPKGVTVGFATCLLFVFLTIPAAIAAQVLYGVSLADSDWLHGSAESLLTITNLVTVVAFRQALSVQERNFIAAQSESQTTSATMNKIPLPSSATMWSPMIWLVTVLTGIAVATAVVPALNDPSVHTPYLGGFLDLPTQFESSLISPPHTDPENSLTVATWIIHISSLVEFLVAMGFCWRWADVTQNPTWRGLTWGLLPLHSSGITACTYHLFYNQIPILVPLQALLTCIGNTTAAWATYRIARSNGWSPTDEDEEEPEWVAFLDQITNSVGLSSSSTNNIVGNDGVNDEFDSAAVEKSVSSSGAQSPSLVGFEDLGQALAGDNDYSFLLKLFVGCAVASYAIKYGELFFDFPFEANVYAGFGFILLPSMLNAYKWYRRSEDPTFEGWF